MSADRIELNEQASSPTQAQGQMHQAFTEAMTSEPKTMILMTETADGRCQVRVVGAPLHVAGLLEVGDRSVENLLRESLSAQRLNG